MTTHHKQILINSSIEELDLPENIKNKLQEQNITEVKKLMVASQVFSVVKKITIHGITPDEMLIIGEKIHELLHSKKTINDITNPQPILDGTQVNIAQWEKRFAVQVRTVQLIGEIYLSEDELLQLSNLFHDLFKSNSENEALKIIEKRYPVSYLVFMVAHGVYGYKAGDYWGAIEKALEKKITQTNFGRLFEKLIGRFKKNLFPDLREISSRFVSLILAHGGIPVYCLNDYFNNIVVRSSVKPEFVDLGGEELISEFLKNSTYTQNTDKPVKHFLEFGGKTAVNVLDRSRKMFLEWQEKNSLTVIEEADLPAHITIFFRDWVNTNNVVRTERSTKTKLKRPTISLDPWGLGVFLTLPSQPVSALEASELSWKISIDDHEQELKVRTQRRGEQLLTREIIIRITDVAKNIMVQFQQGGRSFDWTISLFSPEKPILSFDPSTMLLQNKITAKENWLSYPAHLKLSILDGNANLLEVLPELPGDWAEFKLENWDLSSALQLGLDRDEQRIMDVHIRSQELLMLPYLDGGTIIPTNLNENPNPLYVGTPPKLLIPIGRPESIEEELSRWQIRITPNGICEPALEERWVYPFELSGQDYSVQGDLAMIDLSSIDLLTSSPMGTFQINIKGPLGRDVSYTFDVVREFFITGLKEYYLPNDGHLGHLNFTIQTSLLDGLDTIIGSDGQQIRSISPGRFELILSNRLNQIGLALRTETLHGQIIRIPIHLSARRVRWRVVGGVGLEPTEAWHYEQFSMSVQEVLQDESPILIMDLPGVLNQEYDFELALVDFQGNTLQQLKPAEGSNRPVFMRYRRFDLKKIKHLLEINESPVFRLDLIGKAKNTETKSDFQFPALSFAKNIELEDLKVDSRYANGMYHIVAEWNSKIQLRSRAFVLWSIFRPWQSPILERIPDSAVDHYAFSLLETQAAGGLYKVQMIVLDPWSSPRISSYPPESNCIEFEVSPTESYLTVLRKEVKINSTNEPSIAKHLEISLICHRLGELQFARQMLGVCCQALVKATSREILALSRILDRIEGNSLVEEFGKQVFSEEVLELLKTDWRAGTISLDDVKQILNFIPDSQLWTLKACEALVQIDDPAIQKKALEQLVERDVVRGIDWILKSVHEFHYSMEDAAVVLFSQKQRALNYLKQKRGEYPVSEELIKLLNLYDPFSGTAVVRAGSWVLSNAGWGRIEEILDAGTKSSVDSFVKGSGKYILIVSLHITISYDLKGEKAQINMARETITFFRASSLYVCSHCDRFATSKIELFRAHLVMDHGNAILTPRQKDTTLPLTYIEFSTHLN